MQSHTESATAPRAPREPGHALATACLWASAFLLAALTVFQAGRSPHGSAQAAGAANQGAMGTSVITLPTGLGPDNKGYEALWMIDGRGEMLFIYYIENGNAGEKALLLRHVVSLPDLFRTARGS